MNDLTNGDFGRYADLYRKRVGTPTYQLTR